MYLLNMTTEQIKAFNSKSEYFKDFAIYITVGSTMPLQLSKNKNT